MFPKNPLGKNLPIGGIRVGNSIGYPDINGVIHSTPGAAIDSNMGIESDFSRGSSGGCPQTPSLVPNPLDPKK